MSSLMQAVMPVGNIPEDVMQRYVSLIATHKQVSPANIDHCNMFAASVSCVLTMKGMNVPLQVELSSFQSIVQTQAKSPFKSFPWKTGAMHFRFLPVRTDLQA